jgi:hypothetical protein
MRLTVRSLEIAKEPLVMVGEADDLDAVSLELGDIISGPPR